MNSGDSVCRITCVSYCGAFRIDLEDQVSGIVILMGGGAGVRGINRDHPSEVVIGVLGCIGLRVRHRDQVVMAVIGIACDDTPGLCDS